jgi:threonine synthase
MARASSPSANYDDVNRLCTQVADKSLGLRQHQSRAYYAEGAKTTGFEIAEQLGWRFPRHVVSPVAGGTLLPRILKGFEEFRRLGLVAGDLPSIHMAQAAGCAPVVRALDAGLEYPEPVKPKTIAKSIAIGNPADGFQVLRAVRSTGGSGATVEEDEIAAGITLLAETEGIFTEAAGGITVPRPANSSSAVSCRATSRSSSASPATGYKTVEILSGIVKPIRIGRSLSEFESVLEAATPAAS